MEKYVFSGSLTNQMHEYLKSMPGFEPLDILVSQIDRSGVRQAIEYKKEGFCRWFFVDSGAFSIHTGKAHTTVDEYIEFLDSIDEYYDVCAQLDTIPGTFGQPKSAEDYALSAQKSWENFLYMREHMKSPSKLMPVFHYGENFDALRNMLTWRDEQGNLLDYIGISPANDAHQTKKNTYLGNVAEVIAGSDNPHVKTHLYGMTSLSALSKYPCYSADSISHRLIAGYAKIISSNFGVISVSNKSRTTKSKSNMSFVETADAYNLKKLEEELAELGFTLEQIQEDSNARVAVNMHNIQKLMKTTYSYKSSNIKKPRKLF